MQMTAPLPGRENTEPSQAELDKDAESFMAAYAQFKKKA